MDFTNIKENEFTDFKDILCNYNAKLISMIEADEDIDILVKEFNQSNITKSETYRLASYIKELIGPHLYINGFDITNFTNDILVNNSNLYDRVLPYITKLSYSLSAVNNLSEQNVFDRYLKKLNKIYEWSGTDIKGFRDEIKLVTKLKKDCEFRLNFKISNLDTRIRTKIEASTSAFEAYTIIKDILDDKALNSYEKLENNFEISLPDSNEKFSFTHFLDEDLKIYKYSLTNYFKGEEISNKKQLMLCLALFIEIPLLDNIDKFLNVNSVSIRNPTSYINDYCSIYDYQIANMLKSGFDKDVILCYLKKHGYTRQRKDKE